MPIVDHIAVAPCPGPTAGKCHQWRGGEEHLETVVVKAHGQLVANQTRRHGVEHAANGEPARARDAHPDRVEVIRALPRQGVENRPLGVDAHPQMGVASADHLVDERAVVAQRVEVARAAQQERVLQAPLEMPVRPFDRAVLVRLAAVVPRRRHGVVRTQRSIGGGLNAVGRGGQTRGKFCAAHGLALSTFDLWRRKLGATPVLVDEGRPEPVFVELTNPAQTQMSPTSTGTDAWEVELELGAGVVLHSSIVTGGRSSCSSSGSSSTCASSHSSARRRTRSRLRYGLR